MHKFQINIYTPQELNHSSYVQTGLEEVAYKNGFSVATQFSCDTNRGTLRVLGDEVLLTHKAQPKTSFYELIDLGTQKKIRFACDLYDLDHEFSSVALAHCDYVFKRNFRSAIVEKLTLAHRDKIYPLGLTFGVRSNRHQGGFLLFMGLYCQNLKLVWKYDRFFITRLVKECSKQWKHWRFVQTTRKLDRFDHFKVLLNDKILFQTRTFDENQEDIVSIHKQRYQIIKLLKASFPEQFYGGFIPKGIALSKYPDALSNVLSDPETYLNVVKGCSIVVYTRGVANSPAWKMAEYLSQGKVIMAEPLTTELPAPLEDGIHLLYFRNEEELISNIKKVQSDPQLALRLSQNARNYFEEHVHPTKNIERILTFMMQKEGWIP